MGDQGADAGTTQDDKNARVFFKAAEDQNRIGTENVDKANAQNRPDYAGPFGQNFGFQTDPKTGKTTVEQSFGGALGDADRSLQQGYADSLRQPLNGDAARDEAFNASYGQATSRMDPEWDARDTALQTQIMNSGFDPDSNAAKNANRSFANSRNDAYTGAMNSALGSGMQAGDAAFQQNLGGQEAQLQQMQQMAAMLRQPDFNQAQANAAPNRLRDVELQANASNKQASIDNQNTTNAIQGTAEGLKAAASVAALLMA